MLIQDPKLPGWGEWYDAVTRGESQQQIAERLGVSRATVARWNSRGVLVPKDLIALSRAYGSDALTGLLVSGWLRAEDFQDGGMAYVLSRAPMKLVVTELYRRLGQ